MSHVLPKFSLHPVATASGHVPAAIFSRNLWNDCYAYLAIRFSFAVEPLIGQDAENA
ncbi:hypothetical protein [Pseudodesulfovibrio nedwellii]|uniref:hypothetical protein n=1 Tax=Pseudodesulfovibrio nedwellii TaxID=2973072 RepID=UPI0024928D51|nr:MULTISPECIES: hypothetical protein [Pseudodesulfovibrio]